MRGSQILSNPVASIKPFTHMDVATRIHACMQMHDLPKQISGNEGLAGCGCMPGLMLLLFPHCYKCIIMHSLQDVWMMLVMVKQNQVKISYVIILV